MRNFRILFLFFSLIIALAGCKSNSKDTDNKNGTQQDDIPAADAAKIKEDAARLAVRALNRGSAGQVTNAKIPVKLQTNYYNALVAIYRLVKSDKNIPDITRIHTHPNPNLREVLVVLEKDSPFIDRWSKGYTSTDDLYVNQLFADHGLRIKDYREAALGPTLIVYSNNYFNTPELARLLGKVTGIKLAEPQGIAGDGNNIQTDGDDNLRKYAYSVGYGDCPSGCIKRHYFSFEVNAECKVTYLGESGDPLPADWNSKE